MKLNEQIVQVRRETHKHAKRRNVPGPKKNMLKCKPSPLTGEVDDEIAVADRPAGGAAKEHPPARLRAVGAGHDQADMAAALPVPVSKSPKLKLHV